MPLPTTGGCSSWDLLFQYTITDSGLAADENFNGMIDKVIIRDGNDAQAVFHVETNELQKVGQWLGSRVGIQETPAGAVTKWGTDSGTHFIDDLPTTAEAQFGFYRFHQKINFDSLKNPVLEIQLNPVQEAAGASAFSGIVKFGYTPSAVNSTEYVSRTFTASETRSEIDLGEYPVIDVMWSTDDAATANTEGTTLMGADGNNDIDANEPIDMIHYAGNFQTSGAGSTTDIPTTFVSGPILSEPHSKRKLITRSATAAVMTVHYVSLARIVEHDESRSQTGPAARFGQKKVRSVLRPGFGNKLAKLPSKKLGRVLKGRGFRGL
jgi:hypothetical protein